MAKLTLKLELTEEEKEESLKYTQDGRYYNIELSSDVDLGTELSQMRRILNNYLRLMGYIIPQEEDYE